MIQKQDVTLTSKYSQDMDEFCIYMQIDGVTQKNILVLSPQEFNDMRTQFFDQNQVREAILFLKEQGYEMK